LLFGSYIKKEVNRVCTPHGRISRYFQNVDRRPKENKVPRAHGCTVLKRDLREHDVAKRVDWIYLAQEMIQWRTLLKTAMSLRVEYGVPLGYIAAPLEGHNVLTFNVLELRENENF